MILKRIGAFAGGNCVYPVREKQDCISIIEKINGTESFYLYKFLQGNLFEGFPTGHIRYFGNGLLEYKLPYKEMRDLNKVTCKTSNEFLNSSSGTSRNYLVDKGGFVGGFVRGKEIDGPDEVISGLLKQISFEEVYTVVEAYNNEIKQKFVKNWGNLERAILKNG